jgi:hypothetical protein
MKKLIYVLLILILTSCRDYVEYELYTERIIPDSLVTKHRQYVVELVKASNYNHDAGKSKNKGHILNDANWVANRLYEVKVPALRIKYYINSQHQSYRDQIILYDDLTVELKIKYDSLLLIRDSLSE